MKDHAPPQAQAQSLSFSYVPRSGLLKITLINLLFSILTFTIYRFWGKTNVRRHIWSCIHINGEPLEYTGTGMELFKGFLFVFGLFILPYIVATAILQLTLGDGHPLILALNALFFLFVYVMFGFAIYKARKYQLTRTLWRGIRGNLAGSAMTYSLTYFGAMLAKGFSFGWATPAMNTVLHEQITNDMRFGDAAFKFKGRAGPLYGTYALCWFLFLGFIIGGVFLIGGTVAWLRSAYPDLTTSGLSGKAIWGFAALGVLFIAYMVLLPALWAIYVAKEMRVFADYTRFDGAQFRLNATAGSIIWLTLVNFLILVFTLGIGWPYIQQRVFRYVFDRLRLDGSLDIDRIAQSQLTIPRRGEGLADAFDVGAW
jgi:uncharacterized membrane protein YjgN (DUF898 family)